MQALIHWQAHLKEMLQICKRCQTTQTWGMEVIVNYHHMYQVTAMTNQIRQGNRMIQALNKLWKRGISVTWTNLSGQNNEFQDRLKMILQIITTINYGYYNNFNVILIWPLRFLLKFQAFNHYYVFIVSDWSKNA